MSLLIEYDETEAFPVYRCVCTICGEQFYIIEKKPMICPFCGQKDAPVENIEKGHRWDYCDACETEMVVCGTCGNACCNAGYGELPDGSKCPDCPSAYEKQEKEGYDHGR